MDSIENIILNFTDKLNKSLLSVKQHNHPPMVGIVPGCSYCNTFGNIFEHGPVHVDNNQALQKHVLCLRKKNVLM